MKFSTNVGLLFLIAYLGISQFSFSQILEDVDFISPFNEELAAIKKGDQWAFINREGVKVIDFRSDLDVSISKTSKSKYPIFVEDKCLIKKMIDGVLQFGYIDKKGTTIIEPQFLNATNFKDGNALVIKLEKTKMGTNSLLGKPVTNAKMEEYVIDAMGKDVKYLESSRGYNPSKIIKRPKFNSMFITSKLVAVKTKAGKWNLYKL